MKYGMLRFTIRSRLPRSQTDPLLSTEATTQRLQTCELYSFPCHTSLLLVEKAALTYRLWLGVHTHALHRTSAEPFIPVVVGAHDGTAVDGQDSVPNLESGSLGGRSARHDVAYVDALTLQRGVLKAPDERVRVDGKCSFQVYKNRW